jgi:hypothetical protein
MSIGRPGIISTQDRNYGTISDEQMGLSRLGYGLILLAALAWASPPVKKKAVPEKPSSDAQIEAEIRRKFANSKISTNGFTVQVRGGTATIEGRTAVLQHKGTATRLARNAGARQVVNRIEVDRAAREKAAANLQKARKRAQIKRSEPRSQR